MFVLLRFVGLVNAAVWLGSAVFLTFAAGPAVFSPQMAEVLPRYHAGRVAQILLSRYFILQYVCSGIAVLHLLAEWLYAGRKPGRFDVTLVSVLLGCALLGGIWLQPKMKQLHVVKYATNTSLVQKEAATRSFGLWHGVSQSFNLVLLGGILAYFWRKTNDATLPRPLRSPRPLR